MSHVTLNEPYDILKDKENHICVCLRALFREIGGVIERTGTAWIDGLIVCTAPRSLLPNWAVWLVERIPVKAWQDIIDCDRHFAQVRFARHHLFGGISWLMRTHSMHAVCLHPYKPN